MVNRYLKQTPFYALYFGGNLIDVAAYALLQLPLIPTILDDCLDSCSLARSL